MRNIKKSKRANTMTEGAIKQEIKDLKEYQSLENKRIQHTLNQILEQTKRTNGRVTTLEANEKSCPAKAAFVNGSIRTNLWNTGSIIVAIAAVIVSIIAALN